MAEAVTHTKQNEIDDTVWNTGHRDSESSPPQKTVLFLLMPERSAFNASFSLAKALQQEGFRVLYLGFEGEFQQHVSSQGMSYIAIPEESAINEEDSDGQRSTWFSRWQRTRQSVKRGNERERARFRQCEAILVSEHVDLVLLDPLIWYFALPALRQHIPVVNFSTSLSCAYDPRVPPVFSDLAPTSPPSWKSNARNRLSWLAHLWRIWAVMEIMARTWSFKYALLPEPPLVSQIRRASGRVGWSEYGPRLRGPELVAAPAAFDFPECAAISGRVYLGPCVDVQRRDDSSDGRTLDPDKPLVYCSLGTYSHVYRHAKQLFEAVIEALRSQENLQAIIQIGTAAPPDAFGEMPGHIQLVERVAQVDVLARANVFITHGGLSSVREACYFGTPMLVFPCWNDQPGNAARVAHHRLGLHGDIATVNAQTINAMLCRALAGEFAIGLQSMKTAFHSTKGEQAALALLTNIVERAPRQGANL